MAASVEREWINNRRILLVDDNEDIHHDFRRILKPGAGTDELDELEAELLGQAMPAPLQLPAFELTSAFQGEEALAKVQKALQDGTPYALAFIDVRMPPGWDGVETLQRIWQVDSRLQAVLCTAYSDYSWESINEKLGRTDRLLILKKPFDAAEVRQLACSQVEKWNHLAASPPLLMITDDILILPLTGLLSLEQLRQAREVLVERALSQRPRVAILDVTGVARLTSEITNELVHTAQAVRQAGAEVVLTGISPEALRPLAQHGSALGGVMTHPTLQGGFAFAMGKG